MQKERYAQGFGLGEENKQNQRRDKKKRVEGEDPKNPVGFERLVN